MCGRLRLSSQQQYLASLHETPTNITCNITNTYFGTSFMLHKWIHLSFTYKSILKGCDGMFQSEPVFRREQNISETGCGSVLRQEGGQALTQLGQLEESSFNYWTPRQIPFPW